MILKKGDKLKDPDHPSGCPYYLVVQGGSDFAVFSYPGVSGNLAVYGVAVWDGQNWRIGATDSTYILEKVNSRWVYSGGSIYDSEAFAVPPVVQVFTDDITVEDPHDLVADITEFLNEKYP